MHEILNMRKEDSLLRKKDLNKLTSQEIYIAAKKGDMLALEAFEITGEYIGMKLADAVAFSSPEAIILFGGLAKAGNYILNPVKKYMEQNLLSIYKNKVKLVLSDINNENAAVLGAAALGWENLNKK